MLLAAQMAVDRIGFELEKKQLMRKTGLDGAGGKVDTKGAPKPLGNGRGFGLGRCRRPGTKREGAPNNNSTSNQPDGLKSTVTPLLASTTTLAPSSTTTANPPQISSVPQNPSKPPNPPAPPRQRPPGPRPRPYPRPPHPRRPRQPRTRRPRFPHHRSEMSTEEAITTVVPAA